MKKSSAINVPSSIQTRVIFTTVFVITIILAGFATFDYLNERSDKYSALEKSTDVAATRLAATLSIPLWDLDKELVAETLESEMLNPNIVALIVRDTDGTTIFAAKRRDANWLISDIDANSGVVAGIDSQSRFKTKLDVTFGEEVIGKVEVFVTARFVDEELTQSLIATIFTVFVLDLIIFIILLVLLRSLIIKPIMQLSESVERMSRGELDVELDFSRRDEIGLVANAIERMQVSLRIAMGRLSRSTPNE
ncbi:MAG: HAMP domain-containing protein [Pseudomonadota bacterium]